MKGILTIIGVGLILLGGFALVYGGITYTSEETVVDIGPIEATAETRETLPVSPILGALAVACGGFLLYRGRRAE